MTRRLSDITEFIIDTKHNTPEYADEGYPCIRTPNIGCGYFDLENVRYVSETTYEKWTERAAPKEDDLILAREAPVGNVAWIPPGLKVCIGQRTVLIRPLKEIVESRYLKYYLLSDECQNRMHALSGGATVAHLNMSDIRAFEVHELPTMIIQKQIAAILSAYDDLIENNLRRIKILEEMAQNLYREWFVNFRFPGHEQTHFVDSPLGRIPEGWVAVPAKEFLQKNIGGSWGKDEPSEENSCEVRVIRGTDFKKIGSGLFDDVPTRFIKPKELSNRLIQPGDLLVENSINASSRCVGTPRFITSGILNMLKLPSICASFCKLYRPFKSEHASLLYLHMNYLLAEGKMHYYQNVAANGIGNFQSQRFLEDEKIIVPSDSSILKLLLNKLSPLLTSNYAERIAILRQTRDLLLPKLISGEVDVSNIDINVSQEDAV